MNWADSYIKELKEGKVVRFRPKGNSMSGLIESGQLCTVDPLLGFEEGLAKVVTGDVVLCKVKGNIYLHLVKGIRSVMKVKDGKKYCQNQYLIGNNKGKLNGWTSIIYGVLIKVE